MNIKEEAKTTMYDLTALFSTNHEATFTGFARLSPTVATQSAVTTGITDDKSAAFNTLQGLVVKAARKALVWANDTGNKELAAIFDISANSFTDRTNTKKIALAKSIAAALTANAAALTAYNITPATITALSNAITACEDRATAPGAAAKNKKTATTTLKATLKAIDASLGIIDDLLISEYTDTNPELVTGYRNNRRVDEVGVRHTGISATITDATTGTALEGATLTPMKAGSYSVRFVAAGYAAQTLEVKVIRGKLVEVKVGLVKG